jgi:GTP-binding protein HflX
LLVHLDLTRHGAKPADLAELQDLAQSAGLGVAGTVCGRRVAPDPRFFVGQGKADEIKAGLETHGADLVVFDHELSPAQQRNLETHLGVRVLDRTELILHIFALRAQTFEGKLQVELAQLQHWYTRLVGGWSHLERQRGGIGLRGGPGEKQLEMDRRLIAQRIKQTQKRIERVRAQRGEIRRGRKRRELPVIALVGYTNAGKSTLFNALTDAGIYVADKLFATLDPTVRGIAIPGIREARIADTVGFISQLPHGLVAAFRATLEEVKEADLLLHVIDAGAARRDEQKAEVEAVLTEIGAEAVPRLEVYNKIDQMDGHEPRVIRDADETVRQVWLSALAGTGLDLLRSALAQRLAGKPRRHWLRIAFTDSRLRARLYGAGVVCREVADDGGHWMLELEADEARLRRLIGIERLDLSSVAAS